MGVFDEELVGEGEGGVCCVEVVVNYGVFVRGYGWGGVFVVVRGVGDGGGGPGVGVSVPVVVFFFIGGGFGVFYRDGVSGCRGPRGLKGSAGGWGIDADESLFVLCSEGKGGGVRGAGGCGVDDVVSEVLHFLLDVLVVYEFGFHVFGRNCDCLIN